MTDSVVRVLVPQMQQVTVDALVASGTSLANAQHTAEALVSAEIDGKSGHGLVRVAAYAAQVRCGKVDGGAVASLRQSKEGFAVVDAAHGFAFPALALARDWLIRKTPETGIAGVSVCRSHHCGALSFQVEALSRVGLVALMVANAPRAMSPWGGSQPLLGTNPIAFSCPVLGASPVTIDLGLSRMARGKVMAAKKLGQPIPPGMALDSQGQPTTDADAALKGSMLPAGESKGAALALMVEILAGALAGPHLSFEASSLFDAQGPPPSLGQFLLAIDPKVAGEESFSGRVAKLLAAMTEQEGVRIPGSGYQQHRDQAEREGVCMAASIWREVVELASMRSR